MRIALLDHVGWQYDADTPYDRPLGGTQSAMCYLGCELARLGHAVTIANGNPSPSESRGVQFRNYGDILRPGSLNDFDAVIDSTNAIGERLRRDSAVTVPRFLWIHAGNTEELAVAQLHRPAERDSWTGFVFVSNWQREQFEKRFAIPREKSRVLRNAVSPAFAEIPEAPPWFAVSEPPVLFYTSPPYRGLDVLLQAFPTIRAALPGTRLKLFSGMGVYQVRSEDEPFRELYRHAQSIDGVEYEGVVGQARLAQEMTGAAALAYPSTDPESSCIAALEAMAAGAAVLATKRGALAETTNGFGFLTDWRDDRGELALHFAAITIAVLDGMRQNPAAAAAHRAAQIAFIRANYLWPARAREWVDFLSQLAPASVRA